MNLANPDMATWAPGKTSADPFFDPASTNAVCALNVNGLPTPIIDATLGTQVGILTLPIPTVPRAKIYNRPMIAVDSTGAVNLYVGTGDSDNPGTLGNYDYFYGLSDVGPGCAAPLFVLRFDVSEKVLSEPAFLNNTIFVTTYAPVNDPTKICETGHGFLYSFDARTGLPVLALKDPFNGNNPVSKLDLGDMRNGQLVQRGIPSSPVVRATSSTSRTNGIRRTRGRSTSSARPSRSRSADGSASSDRTPEGVHPRGADGHRGHLRRADRHGGQRADQRAQGGPGGRGGPVHPPAAPVGQDQRRQPGRRTGLLLRRQRARRPGRARHEPVVRLLEAESDQHRGELRAAHRPPGLQPRRIADHRGVSRSSW
jgi:hypothetical protein